MNNEEIFNGLKEVIGTVKPKLDLTTVTLDSNLVRDLGIDSLSMLLLSLATEQKFNIQFDTQVQFQTVKDVVDYISKSI